MAMSHHFGPSDRDPSDGAFDLGALAYPPSAARLTPRAEAEARFFAHIALSNLPHDSSDLSTTRQRYSEFLSNLFEPQDRSRGEIDVEIVATCLTSGRDVFLASVRERTTGELLLPRPDDILKLDPGPLLANARRFEEDTFCGILFDITPRDSNFLVEATPVLLPRLMRREAIRFHNGDSDSLVGELLTRFARREISPTIRFTRATVADDSPDDGLVLLLADDRGRQYAAKIVNPGGGLLHEVEFFIPLQSVVTPTHRGAHRSIDLGESFKRNHIRYDYTVVERQALAPALIAHIEATLRESFKEVWEKTWRIDIHGAALAADESRHYHIFTTIEDRHGLRVIPGPHGDAIVQSRKLGGLLVHVDELPCEGFWPNLKATFGAPPSPRYASRVEAWLLHPRVLASEIERLVSRPREGIFDFACRELIAADLDKRGKSGALGDMTFGPFAAWSHDASKVPLRAIIATHRHGKHLLSFGFDERLGVLHPDHDIRVEGYFPV